MGPGVGGTMGPVDTSSRLLPPFAPPSVVTERGGGREEGMGEDVTAVKADALLVVIADDGAEEEGEVSGEGCWVGSD